MCHVASFIIKPSLNPTNSFNIFFKWLLQWFLDQDSSKLLQRGNTKPCIMSKEKKGELGWEVIIYAFFWCPSTCYIVKILLVTRDRTPWVSAVATREGTIGHYIFIPMVSYTHRSCWYILWATNMYTWWNDCIRCNVWIRQFGWSRSTPMKPQDIISHPLFQLNKVAQGCQWSHAKRLASFLSFELALQ